ncbi:MAG TPA: DUF3971 domain-containing protein, partial [Ramlibacter sp.]|nr:DUF3971 domain-containing protein [Ramlibacter sp.]
MNDSPSPSGPLRAFSAFASALWWLLVAFWLALALAWGVLHGWIVPRIGEWRPALEAQATRALGVTVRIDAISARSEGLAPSFELRGVSLLDKQSREVLRLARVVVSLSPSSLWNLGFEQLYVEKPELDIRRSPDGRIWVAGLDVSRGGDDERAANWFFRQKEVVVLGGAIRWTDEMRAAQPLSLQDVSFVARNGAIRHALRLDATPPPEWGERFSLQGVFRQPLLSTHPGRWQDWHGQAYAVLSLVDLSRLREHASLGAGVDRGRGALRAWVDVDQGRFTGGAVDVAMTQLSMVLAPPGGGAPAAHDPAPLSFASLSGRLSGKSLPGGWEFETRALQFETAEGLRWPGGNVAVSWSAADGRQSERGRVRADRLDLSALRQIANRLPLGADALEALERHAPGGLVERLDAKWQGPMDAPRSYEAHGRVARLELAAQPQAQAQGAGTPGVSGATIDFDFTETGGRARIDLTRGALNLPGVLAEPRVPLDELHADVQWQRNGDSASVDVKGLRLANADVQAEGQLSWRTGDTARGRLPGVLDLQLALPRADGARVWRYLPLGIPQVTRDYVRDAVSAGAVSDGRIRVRGDLHDFPFVDARRGDFRVSARVRDVTYAFVPHAPNRGDRAWAPLTALSGELVFERNGMQIKGAQGRFVGGPGLVTLADASVPDLNAPTVTVNGTVRGPLAESLGIFNASPGSALIGDALTQTTATGTAELKLRLALPLAQLDRSRVQGSVTLGGNDLSIVPTAPSLSKARGVVSFTERGFTLSGAQARALGGDVRIEGGTRAAPVPAGEAASSLRLQGTATAEGLRQARELGFVARLARHAGGAAAYSATLGLRDRGVDLLVTSSLQGLSMALPAPLSKAAEASLPLRFELAALSGGERPTDQISVEVGKLGSVTYLRDLSGPEPRVTRGAIAVGLAAGESAPLPEQGVRANINLGNVNVEAWQEVLDGLTTAAAPPASGAATPPAARASGTASAASLGYLPTTIALRARELKAEGRTLNNLVLGGSRDGLTWRANVDATQLNGYVEYRQSGGAEPGRVLARLARLSIPASATEAVESLLDEQPASIPALDILVDDFELRGKRLGRLEIDAIN